MRRTVIIAVAIGVGAVAWVLLDADPQGREDLWRRVSGVFTEEQAPPVAPNWGDVATKVGQFTEEERALRDFLTPGEEGAAPAP